MYTFFDLFLCSCILLVKFVSSHENLLYLRMVVENYAFVKIIDFACLFERVGLFSVFLHSCNYVVQNYF